MENYFCNLFRGLRLMPVDVRAIGGTHLIVPVKVGVAGRPSVGIATIEIGELLVEDTID